MRDGAFVKSDPLLEHGLPYAETSERFVLASLLLQGGELLTRISGDLKAEDFMLEKHRQIYSTMLALDAAGQRIDRVMVAQRMLEDKQLESIGGLTYMLDLEEGMPHIQDVESWMQPILRASKRRKIIAFCRSTEARCLANEDDDKLLEDAEGILSKLNSGKNINDDWQTPGEVISSDGRGFRQFLSPSRYQDCTIRFPWPELQSLTGGLTDEDLMIVGGRPSHGKSAWVLQMAYAAALAGKHVAYFSIEMSKQKIVRRLLAMMARVELNRIRKGDFTPDELERLAVARENILQLPIHLDYRDYTTPSLRRALKRLMQRHPVSLVIVDHFHLLRGVSAREDEREKFNRSISDIASYRKETNIPWLVLAQSNRKCEDAGDAPGNSSLAETANLERAADLIGFTFRPEMYVKNRDRQDLKGIAEFMLTKQRDGPTGNVQMIFEGAYQSFREREMYRVEERDGQN